MTWRGMGHAEVPQGQLGWSGYWGTVELHGCQPRPEGWIDPPREGEIAAAMVITEWTCPFCGEDNDVWGEGAVYSWMECASCKRSAYLVM